MYIAQIYYYDPQSTEINMQSPQSATTSRRLTLPLTALINEYSLRKIVKRALPKLIYSVNTLDKFY